MKKVVYETMVNDIKELTHDLIYSKSQLDKKDKEIQALKDEIVEWQQKIEEEKEKYKKYAKQVRTKNNEAAKKWLNGYPDE